MMESSPDYYWSGFRASLCNVVNGDTFRCFLDDKTIHRRPSLPNELNLDSPFQRTFFQSLVVHVSCSLANCNRIFLFFARMKAYFASSRMHTVLWHTDSILWCPYLLLTRFGGHLLTYFSNVLVSDILPSDQCACALVFSRFLRAIMLLITHLSYTFIILLSQR